MGSVIMKQLLMLPLAVILMPTFLYARKPSKFIAPPKFLEPRNLTDPKSLIIFGKPSEIANTLTCVVSNADDVKWVYFTKSNDTQQAPMPEQFVQGPILQNSLNNLIVTLSDGHENSVKVRRWEANGFYKCIATNNYGFRIETPPIRFIMPEVYHSTVNVVPQRNNSGNLNAMYSMKCFDDVVERKPKDLIDPGWDLITFYWRKHQLDNSAFQEIKEDSRIKIDQRTGRLFFAYLLASDDLGPEAEYQCYVLINNKPTAFLASRHRLMVLSREEKSMTQVAYPVTVAERKVTCIESFQCLVTCIFGGRQWGPPATDPPTPTWTKPDESIAAKPEGNSMTFLANADAEGLWTCKADAPQLSTDIEVIVKEFPDIIDEMRDTFVEVGTDVEFFCDTRHSSQTKFYINGILETGIQLSYEEYRPDYMSLKLPNTQRNHSGIISCVAFNDIGTRYAAAELNVYDKPIITFEPKNGFVFRETNASYADLIFNCSVELDPKVIKASIHWRSDLPELKDRKLVAGSRLTGIKRIKEHGYTNNVISSFLELEVDSETEKTLDNHNFWCVVEMTFYGLETPISVSSASAVFDVVVGDTIIVPQQRFTDWWIIGLVVAILFCILICVLIAFCVRQNIGEQYNVEDKEKKAGHCLRDELGLNGFTEYTRPSDIGGLTPPHLLSDGDSVKASLDSLDTSEKPIDPDNGSLDQYGDIDAGVFNEDGSFIGEYGKAAPSAV